jgi:hypothetical protein
VADSGPVLVLAGIAAAGSFTHIKATATDHGQTGWMSWAIAVCIDLTCVMAARERQRDRRTGRPPRGWLSWPTLVLIGGVLLSLAANLAQAERSIWGWVVAGTPAAAFLVAVSMLERRAGHRAAKAAAKMVTREIPVREAAVVPEAVPEPVPVPEVEPVRVVVEPEPFMPPREPEPVNATGYEEVIATARDRFSEVLATGEVPTVRMIRREMRVGHPKAKRVHEALSELMPV